jgi:carotenoid cleavage dioxygenase-like enzyme
VAACSGDDGEGSPATTAAPATTPTTTPTTATVAPTTTATIAVSATTPVDPSRPWWMQGGFAPVDREVDATDLTVRGAIPPELTGTYVRNGSNPANGDSPHWFFGDGMAHAVRLEAGRATAYRNRWVRTPLYTGGLGFGQGAPGGVNSQSNVSAFHHGGRLLTSGEVGFPYELNPATCPPSGRGTTVACCKGFTAHPKVDPATGRMHAFGYGFTAPYLEYYIIEPDGTMSHREPIELPRSTMIHDFQITETDAIFWDMPVVFDLEAAIAYINDPTSRQLPYQWHPEHGSRIGIMPLAGGAEQIRWYDIDPCYVFHSVNAFRNGNEVVVDVCRLSSVFAETATWAARARCRWTVNTATGTVTDDVLTTDNPGDLPGRDPRRVGREHRYGYLTGTRERPRHGGVRRAHQARLRHRQPRDIWEPGPTRHASEPLFVPGDPNDLADDAGWLLSFVHDDATGESVLAVLDATAVSAGPVAEVVIPQRVPYGFHGTWIPGSDWPVRGRRATRVRSPPDPRPSRTGTAASPPGRSAWHGRCCRAGAP